MSNDKSPPEPKTVTQQETSGDCVSRLVLLIESIRIELDRAIKQVDANDNFGFENPAWRHLVDAKDQVGLAIISLPND